MEEEIKNNPSQTEYNTQEIINTKINKSLKVANIIVFIITCLFEIYAIWCYGLSIKALLTKDLSALAIIATLPTFMIVTLIITALSIVMTVLANKWKKYVTKFSQPVVFFDKLLRYIGWIYVLINILCFLITLII